MTISFTKVALPYGWLGNMAPFPVMYDNKRWPTTEHLFQALRFAPDAAVRELIRAAKSPMAAKFVAKAWSDLMVIEPTSLPDITNMMDCLVLKVNQHPDLKQKLLDTGNEQIVEDVTGRNRSGRHRFWGEALVDGKWVGGNILGYLWMRLRDRLRETTNGTVG